MKNNTQKKKQEHTHGLTLKAMFSVTYNLVFLLMSSKVKQLKFLADNYFVGSSVKFCAETSLATGRWSLL